MLFEKLKAANPHVEIKHYTDPALARYGRIVDSPELLEAVATMNANFPIPDCGCNYEAQSAFFEDEALKAKLSDDFYGGKRVEIGCCAGHNSKINATEYHKCSEIDTLDKPCIMALGSMLDIDIEKGEYDPAKMEFFFFPAGVSVELYAGTLHYAPMHATSDGFRFIVVLAEGTNTPYTHNSKTNENKMLIMKDKWVICHADATGEINDGAPIWIKGENTQINPV